MKRLFQLSALAGLLLVPQQASAWGTQGHQAVAVIAANLLTPAARREVEHLLGNDAAVQLVRVSTWADEVRPSIPESRRWHYVNGPIAGAAIDMEKHCKEGDCVVGAVQRFSRAMADRALLAGVRAEALTWVVHFVGDLHQPMHCSDNDDRGGNDVKVRVGGRTTNLHSYWDGDVVKQLSQELKVKDGIALGAALSASISDDAARRLSAGNPVEWAQQCFGIGKKVHLMGSAEAPLLLTPAYVAAGVDVARNQLIAAGVHLAATLNTAFR